MSEFKIVKLLDSIQIVNGVLNNFNANVPPTVNNDSSNGYSVGSTWIDVTAKEVYQCVDNSLGAAVWLNLSSFEELQNHINDLANPHNVLHSQLSDKGVNDHAAIDLHIASNLNPHGVTASQAGALAIDGSNTMLADINTSVGSLVSSVADGATSIGLDFKTSNLLSTDGSRVWQISNSTNLHLYLEQLPGALGAGKTFIIKDTHSAANDANRTFMQILRNNGSKSIEIGTTGLAPYNPEIRFFDAANTKIGFPPSDPTYFAFINDFTEMWLGTVGDPTVYFNYYNGTGYWIGRQQNLNLVQAWVSSFQFKNTNNRSLKIEPNSVNGNPVRFNCTSNTSGIYLDDNKFFGFGNVFDARIFYDGTDLNIDTASVGTGLLKLANANNFDVLGTVAATVGNIPAAATNAAQNGWLKLKDNNGVIIYIPYWV